MCSDNPKNTIALSKIDKVIELTKKKIILLEELKESLKYEQCKYELVTHAEKLPITYSLIDLETKEVLISARLTYVTSFINRRKINHSLIYERP